MLVMDKFLGRVERQPPENIDNIDTYDMWTPIIIQINIAQYTWFNSIHNQ